MRIYIFQVDVSLLKNFEYNWNQQQKQADGTKVLGTIPLQSNNANQSISEELVAILQSEDTKSFSAYIRPVVSAVEHNPDTKQKRNVNKVGSSFDSIVNIQRRISNKLQCKKEAAALCEAYAPVPQLSGLFMCSMPFGCTTSLSDVRKHQLQLASPIQHIAPAPPVIEAQAQDDDAKKHRKKRKHSRDDDAADADTKKSKKDRKHV